MILAALAWRWCSTRTVKRVTVFRLGFFLPTRSRDRGRDHVAHVQPQLLPINELLGLVELSKVDFFGRSIILWSMANITTWTFTEF